MVLSQSVLNTLYVNIQLLYNKNDHYVCKMSDVLFGM